MTFLSPPLNQISALNSSITPLASGATFTGVWEDVTAFDSIVMAAITDQDGEYSVEFSPDGVNVDSSLTRFYKTADINPPHRFTITRRYVRVTFENTSASDQTFLRLQTMYGQKESLNAPLDGILSQDFDALPVRPSSHIDEVALGLRQNQSAWNKFGYNPDIDGPEETVWAVGGNFVRMASADTLDIYSSSANDTNGGTGVNSVIIYGVDADWNEQIEIVTMNGVTPVTTSNTWLGVNRMAIYLAGTGEVNAGNITAEATIAASAQAYMPVGEGVTQQCIFFVPDKTKFLAKWLFANVTKVSGGGGTPTITLKFIVYSAVNNAKQEVFRTIIDATVDNIIPVLPEVPFHIGEKSICYIQASSDTTNTSVSARFSGVLYRDRA